MLINQDTHPSFPNPSDSLVSALGKCDLHPNFAKSWLIACTGGILPHLKKVDSPSGSIAFTDGEYTLLLTPSDVCLSSEMANWVLKNCPSHASLIGKLPSVFLLNHNPDCSGMAAMGWHPTPY
jgi:hypothetical protein